jgi:hypothetical protein
VLEEAAADDASRTILSEKAEQLGTSSFVVLDFVTAADRLRHGDGSVSPEVILYLNRSRWG